MPPMPVFPGMQPQPQQPQGFMDRLFPQGGRGMDDPITMMLLQAGAGMLDNQGSFGQGLSSGLQGAAQGLAMGTQFQRQKKQGERQDQEWQLQQQQLQGEQARAAKVAEIQAKTARGEQLTPGDLFTLDPGAFAKQQLEAQNPKPSSELAQLANDRLKGLISDEEFNAAKRKLTYIAPQQPREEQMLAVQTPDGPRYVPRSQAVGMAPARTGSDNEPMEEIYDPNSPTGTSFVPRSQAAGKPGKPPGNGFSMDYDEQGRPIIRMGGRVTDFQEGKNGGLQATPGGKADQISPTEAGTLAGRATGADALATVRQQLVGPDGAVNRMLLGNMEVPLPWTPGRTANQAYDEAVESKLRALTGAAATESEFNRLLSMTKPSFFDSDEAVTAKTDRLDKFLSLSGQRNFSDILNAVEGKPTREGSVGEIPTVSTPEEADALTPGTKFKGPDGVVRVR